MLHFTYVEPDHSVLHQGDVLKKTPRLLELIKEVHPHYAGEEYLYFQVVTQSCDLVQGNGGCKSRYITLAAVRGMDLIVERKLEKLQETHEFKGTKFCSEVHKQSLKDGFNKLFNNNDTHHFFLKAEPDYGLTIDCCTQLHLSISIRAYQHYDLCLEAKILQLGENFRAKLGWLVGNLYSRVGTEDYVPGAIKDMLTFDAFVEREIEKYVVWIRESDFSAFKKRTKNAESITQVRQLMDADRSRSKESQLSQLTSAIVKGLSIDDDLQKQTLKNILIQHPLVQRILDK